MTDRPILFSAPMIEALMAGRKTQTRRVLKPQPPQGHDLVGIYAPGLTAVFNPAGRNHAGDPDKDHMVRLFSLKDRLWVKETHFAHGQWRTEIGLTKTGRPARYFARVVESEALFDLDPGLVRPNSLNCVTGWFKRPSLFMKRSDSRLTLTVTDVRVQRVQDISHDDAVAEGVEHDQDRSRGNTIGWRDYLNRGGKCATARGSFQSLWDSLNADRAPWEGNPWIVAYSFTVHQCNIDQMDTAK